MAAGSSAWIWNHPVIEPRKGRFYNWTTTDGLLLGMLMDCLASGVMRGLTLKKCLVQLVKKSLFKKINHFFGKSYGMTLQFNFMEKSQFQEKVSFSRKTSQFLRKSLAYFQDKNEGNFLKCMMFVELF
jgi:hypothetical protein